MLRNLKNTKLADSLTNAFVVDVDKHDYWDKIFLYLL